MDLLKTPGNPEQYGTIEKRGTVRDVEHYGMPQVNTPNKYGDSGNSLNKASNLDCVLPTKERGFDS